MVELGFCKSGETGQVVKPSNSYDPFANREYFWDGGLTNVFPIVDEDTVIVTPICARFSPNPYISPAVEDDSIRTIRVDPRSEVFLSTANLETLRQMTISSDETVLQGRFSQGHDDAR
jgi:hypothetical protein